MFVFLCSLICYLIMLLIHTGPLCVHKLVCNILFWRWSSPIQSCVLGGWELVLFVCVQPIFPCIFCSYPTNKYCFSGWDFICTVFVALQRKQRTADFFFVCLLKRNHSKEWQLQTDLKEQGKDYIFERKCPCGMQPCWGKTSKRAEGWKGHGGIKIKLTWTGSYN